MSSCSESARAANWCRSWGSTFWGRLRGRRHCPTRSPPGGKPPPMAPDFPSSGKRGRTIYAAFWLFVIARRNLECEEDALRVAWVESAGCRASAHAACSQYSPPSFSDSEARARRCQYIICVAYFFAHFIIKPTAV